MRTTRYTAQHHWLTLENNILSVGITLYGLHPLGFLYTVELTPIHSVVGREATCGFLRGANRNLKILAPLPGVISDTNPELTLRPTLLNRDPEGNGWLYRMSPGDLKEFEDFMLPNQYALFLDKLED